MADFCRRALAYMTRRPLAELDRLPTRELARDLLAELHARPWLLVLDGLERVLVAYTLSAGDWCTSVTLKGQGRARIPPFETVELELDALLGGG